MRPSWPLGRENLVAAMVTGSERGARQACRAMRGALIQRWQSGWPDPITKWMRLTRYPRIAHDELGRRRGCADFPLAQPASFRLPVTGAALLVLAFVVWWAFVFPVNVETAGWTPQQLASDWAAWRAQW